MVLIQGAYIRGVNMLSNLIRDDIAVHLFFVPRLRPMGLNRLLIAPTATLTSCLLCSRRILPSLPGSGLMIFYHDTTPPVLLQSVN